MASCKSDLPVEGSVSAAVKNEDSPAEKPANKEDDSKEEASGDTDAAVGDDSKEGAAPVPAKKARMSKATTMVNTAKEGNEILAGDKLGDTRQDTQAKKGQASSLKKNRTIQQTMEEAKYFMATEKIDLSEGRRTRSAGKPKPEVKKKEPAAKEVKKGKKSGKKTEEKKKDEKNEIEETDEKEASE